MMCSRTNPNLQSVSPFEPPSINCFGGRITIAPKSNYYLPGEMMNVKIIKAGEEAQQGIGYLEDGTMVVIEGGRAHIGSPVIFSVTSALQTSAGRMIFGKFERTITSSKQQHSNQGRDTRRPT